MDGDEVTFEYTWFAGETEASMTQRGSGDSYEVDEDDNFIYCEIIPNDGTVSGDPYTSSTVGKSDSSPTFVQPAELTLSGSGQSAVLTCSGNASDIDGDDITYTFEFHSSLYGDVFYSIVQTTSISHTVSLNDAGYMISEDFTDIFYEYGDYITCIVTANAGASFASSEDFDALYPDCSDASMLSTPELGLGTAMIEEDVSLNAETSSLYEFPETIDTPTLISLFQEGDSPITTQLLDDNCLVFSTQVLPETTGTGQSNDSIYHIDETNFISYIRFINDEQSPVSFELEQSECPTYSSASPYEMTYIGDIGMGYFPCAPVEQDLWVDMLAENPTNLPTTLNIRVRDTALHFEIFGDNENAAFTVQKWNSVTV